MPPEFLGEPFFRGVIPIDRQSLKQPRKWIRVLQNPIEPSQPAQKSFLQLRIQRQLPIDKLRHPSIRSPRRIRPRNNQIDQRGDAFHLVRAQDLGRVSRRHRSIRMLMLRRRQAAPPQSIEAFPVEYSRPQCIRPRLRRKNHRARKIGDCLLCPKARKFLRRMRRRSSPRGQSGLSPIFRPDLALALRFFPTFPHHLTCAIP